MDKLITLVSPFFIPELAPPFSFWFFFLKIKNENCFAAPPFPPPTPSCITPTFVGGLHEGGDLEGGEGRGGERKGEGEGCTGKSKSSTPPPPHLWWGGYSGGGVHRQSRCTPLPSVHARSARMHPSLWERWTLATPPTTAHIFPDFREKRVWGGRLPAPSLMPPLSSPHHLLNPLLSHRRGGSF
nr:hypothetical protein [Morchella crassipes]